MDDLRIVWIPNSVTHIDDEVEDHHDDREDQDHQEPEERQEISDQGPRLQEGRRQDLLRRLVRCKDDQ